MEKSLTLSELAECIGEGLQKNLQPHYWIIAEISEIQEKRNNHCYLELIEKQEDEDFPTAKMRAVIWANTFRMIDPYFESETGSRLAAGMKIMVLVTVTFHAVYGLSLQITDINPSYTIGEDELRRQKIIKQLEDDGVINLNKELDLPRVIQHIAVISSVQAAGYQDFMQQLEGNRMGIQYATTLFPAAMQGGDVESSIVAQLEEIANREDDFDCAVIIRGGGAKADLRWFDNYTIATHIANFPLPIITGIGHDKDFSIADLVAHTSLKTPTAVAEFINETNEIFVEDLTTFQDTVISLFKNEIINQQTILDSFSRSVRNGLSICLLETENKLKLFQQQIQYLTNQAILEKRTILERKKETLKETNKWMLLKYKNALDLTESRITSFDPQTILKQGYTITTDVNGHRITSTKQLAKKDLIQTHFSDGTITSTVN